MSPDPWSALPEPSTTPAREVAIALGTHLDDGLTSAEARARLARAGHNRLDATAPVPAWRKLLAQLHDPLIYLLLAAVAVSIVAWGYEGAHGAPVEALVIAAILVGNAVLGFVQERQAERAVAALRRMAATTARVIRDGREARIAADEIVPGDLLVLAEGDAIVADARVVRASALTVAEAPLTGESVAVLKDAAALPAPAPLGDRVCMVFSGTAVTRGGGRAVVTATGMRTELGRIAAMLERAEEAPTPLQRETAALGRTLGLAVMAIAVVVVATILVTSRVHHASDVVAVLLLGVSLAVAAVPEGLPAILTVILAIGVQRMATRRAIVKRLSSVETLGSATVIGSDKTGTLTRNEMTIQRVVTRSGVVDVDGTGYAPEGEVTIAGAPLAPGPLFDEVRAVLGGGALAGDATLREGADGWTIEGDPTDAAFLVAERKLGLPPGGAPRFTRLGEVPFSAERKLMSAFEADATRAGRIAVVTKGAPGVLLARCTRERVGAGDEPLTEARRAEILATVDALAGEALRTIAVAYRRLDTTEPPSPDDDVERELVFAGVVGMLDPPRPEAADAIAEAQRAGLRVLMITGDHARTGGRIAADLGIAPAVAGGGAAAVAGADLDPLDDDALRARVRDVSVFARVSPEHKLRIIRALKADGHVVAMTGDGVNDAPALRAADIGVAMGVTGTEVSKEASHMILADDNFATIVAAVREGRSIFANIQTCLRYLLGSNIGEVLTMFLGVVLASVIGLDGAGGGFVAPLLATQILWINLLTDSAPALALGFDPPPDDVMDRPPRRSDARVIDRAMLLGLLYVGAVMAIATLVAIDWMLPGGMIEGSAPLAEARTAGFTVLVLAQLFNAFNARSARASAFHGLFHNPRLFGAVALSVALQVAVVYTPALQRAFGTAPLHAGDWLMCVGLASSVLWLEELRKLVARRRAPARR